MKFSLFKPSLPVAILILAVLPWSSFASAAEDLLRKPTPLETLLKETSPELLIANIRERGNPEQGAFLFHQSAAACVRCHAIDPDTTPVGPRLAELVRWHDGKAPSDEYLLRALLYPSREILDRFQVTNLLTEEDEVISGILIEETEKNLRLSSASDPGKETIVPKDRIESRNTSRQSLMPDGLVSSLQNATEFYDLAAYVFEVAQQGLSREKELTPTTEQLLARDDWQDINHAGILGKLGKKDFEAGKGIYHGYCVDCHGPDGNKPSLPIARAFGVQPLKFGADPHSMFMTLSKGNGLMGRMSHLTPRQRYQVVYYIREAFMKGSNPDYKPQTPAYLASLPKGKKTGDEFEIVQRDFGASLGSQLGRNVQSALTTREGEWTVTYDLHTMNPVAIWQTGFLDLSETQHYKGKGEGVPVPDHPVAEALLGWRWGHGGTLDYDEASVPPRGPLPKEWMRYRGYYRDGRNVLLRYEIDEREIHERLLPSPREKEFARTLQIGPGKELIVAIVQWPNSSEYQVSVSSERGTATRIANAGVKEPPTHYRLHVDSNFEEATQLQRDNQGRIVWRIPASDQTRECVIRIAESTDATFKSQEPFPTEGRILKQGKGTFEGWKQGTTLWPEVLTTTGYLGLEQEGYALDTISIPTKNPWNAWMRTGALDFFPDGRMVVTTYGGDVWLVDGVDATLKNLRWKRFASGLYEPLGVKVIDNKIYATCRDRIVRLHDNDGDDEADYYENFFDDPDVSTHFHGFNFDLQVDSKGWISYGKCGHGADYKIPGAIVRISPDGETFEEYCTGLRVPNGTGILPDDRLTCSDNQGQWMPASKVNLLKRGGFYGWSPTYNDPGKWSADGGKIDVKKVVPPTDFDKPLVWIPYELDNSSGGQLWPGDRRWGPLAENLLHTSFGKGWMFYILMQEVGDKTQGAFIRLPFDFQTGIMRARVNPVDGQVYTTGMQGWNGSGRLGLQDQGIQRLRYTGQEWKMVTAARAVQGALIVDFNFPIDPQSVEQEEGIQIASWNYRWSASYGSDRYSPSTGKPGMDPWVPSKTGVSEDRKKLTIHLPDLKPVDQLRLQLRLRDAGGKPWEEEVYWTIQTLPE